MPNGEESSNQPSETAGGKGKDIGNKSTETTYEVGFFVRRVETTSAPPDYDTGPPVPGGG